jgi:hypothetical protein
MDLICPDCRGNLQMASARWAVCAQHGGRFEVLFDRYAAPSHAKTLAQNLASAQRDAEPGAALSTPATAAVPQCRAHPRQSAVAACSSCGSQLCTLCTFEVNGVTFCSECAAARTRADAGLKLCPECELSMPASIARCDCGHHFGLLNLSAPRRRTLASGQCAEHPEMEAVARCRLCAKSICATCDFSLPGGVHLCPACIETQSSAEISPKRKKQTYIAMALATWSTLLFGLLLSGAFKSLLTSDEGGRSADAIITNLTLWPLLIGTGLSLGALDRKLKNSGFMKAVAWWNSVLAGIFLLIIIAVSVGLIGR